VSTVFILSVNQSHEITTGCITLKMKGLIQTTGMRAEILSRYLPNSHSTDMSGLAFFFPDKYTEQHLPKRPSKKCHYFRK